MKDGNTNRPAVYPSSTPSGQRTPALQTSAVNHQKTGAGRKMILRYQLPDGEHQFGGIDRLQQHTGFALELVHEIQQRRCRPGKTTAVPVVEYLPFAARGQCMR